MNGLTLLELLSSGLSKTTKHYRLLLLFLVTCQDLKVRPHCWRYHVLESQNLEKSGTNLKVSFLPLDFIVLKVVRWLPGKKSNHQSYLAVNSVSYNKSDWPDRHVHQCNSGRNTEGVTNHFVIGFKSHFTKWNPYLSILSTQEHITREGIGTMGEPTAVTLLNDYYWLTVIPID